MDDLLAMMDGSSDNENDINELHSINECDTDDLPTRSMDQTRQQSHHSKQTESRKTPRASSASSTGCIDPLTKIRIVQRQTSKVDLVDLLASFQFHTSALLANMPKTQLSTLITHPSNNDEVGGRTDMATMGIIFTNSGTRISKNGRAFSILTLGDLHTGPTISIFLFGHAYSDFTTKIKPGAVVAIVAGSIMPPKGNYGGETRMSLSVNDIQQIIMVGKAMDYGTCAAMNTDRRNGTNINNGHGREQNQVKCKKYVDLRLGRFCNFHAKQQHQQQNHTQSGSSNSGSRNRTGNGASAKNMTFVQGLRAEKDMRQRAIAALNNPSSNRFGKGNSQPLPNVMTMVIPGQGAVVTHNPNSNANNLQRGGLGRSQALNQALASNLGGMEGMSTPSQTRSLQRAPKHMKVSSAPVAKRAVQVASRNKNIQNPYAKSTTTTVTVSSNISTLDLNKTKGTRTTTSNTQDILGQALLGPSSSRQMRNATSHTPLIKGKLSQPAAKVRKRNLVHMEGMNGAVQVPKPNPLFRKSTPNPYKSGPCTYASEPVTPSPQQKSALMDRQRQLAEQLKNNASTGSGTSTKTKVHSRTKSKSSATKSGLDEMLGAAPLSDSKRSSILEAKSKYSQQAKAESYAKSRQAVSELEKQEAAYDKKQERKKSKSNSMQGEGHAGTKSSIGSAIIVSEYKCVTCNKITQSKPMRCIREKHKVKRKREIKKQENTAQKRMNLKNRSVDDGGLVLGAGLEWSSW